MSSHNEQVQPTPFDVAQPEPAPEPLVQNSTRHGTPRWVIPALGGLLLLALLVVFWLPQRVTPEKVNSAGTQPTLEQVSTQAAAQASRPYPATEDASPWTEAQLAKLRKEAQEVLAELLDVQSLLEERGVQQWAPQPFAEAAAIATAADELYKSRQYEDATAGYREALAALLALQDSIPEELAAQLAAARQALEDGATEQANTALDMATLIDSASADLAALRQRAEVQPQLLPLLDQAAQAEQEGDLSSAEKLLQQATAVDPQHLRARSELQRVAAAHQQQQFNDAMSEGYTALDESRFDAARKAFRAAEKLQAGSAEAASALQEVQASETAWRLSRLKQSGQKYEGQERWNDAVKAYEQAQKIDGNVLFATEGLMRARPRAQLDKQLRKVLEQPARLSDEAVAKATGQLLGHAQKLNSQGPVLAQQLRQVQVLLQQANTPIEVTLLSDQETEVTVLKVKRLGRFQQQQLTLRPGTYTAKGSRNGYRDVRRTFTITHDNTPTPITVTCTESI